MPSPYDFAGGVFKPTPPSVCPLAYTQHRAFTPDAKYYPPCDRPWSVPAVPLMIEVTSAPPPPSPRERLKHAATAAAGWIRRYGPLALAGAVGWACGYGLLGEELKLSALSSPWNRIPASWLLPFQKGTLTFAAEAVQSLALPRGHRWQWAMRGAFGAWVATILWQWRQLDYGEGILLYGVLVAVAQFAPSGLRQRTRGLRSFGWLLLWLMARTFTWSIALLLTVRLGQLFNPHVGWAVGGIMSGLLLALFLQLGPKETPPRVAPPPVIPSLPVSHSGASPSASVERPQ
jgi:hypothetical protein